jgi:hypothetical protein
MSAGHVNFFFGMREQIKLYHWQTKMYSRHKATDEVLEKLDKLIDMFVEVWMGKYLRHLQPTYPICQKQAPRNSLRVVLRNYKDQFQKLSTPRKIQIF